MGGRVVTAVVGRVRLAAVLGAAVAIGAAGSAYALTASHDGSTTVTTVADSSRPSTTPTGPPTSPGTSRDGGGSQQGADTHGACVAKVARDKTAVGGAHDNHGGAVAAAAHSCPKPGGGVPSGGAPTPDPKGTHGQSGMHGQSGQHGRAPGAPTGRPTAGS